MSNVIRVPRDGQGAAPAQSRNAAALETEMIDAAEQEAQRLLVATRDQIRDILTKARQDLLVLRGQIEAGHEHVRGADTYTRHLVREVAGSIRPEIEAFDREIAATQHAVLQYRAEITEAPLLPEPHTPELVTETAPSGHSRRALAVAAVVAFLVVTTGVVALRWRTRPPTDGPRVAELARAVSPTTPVPRAGAKVPPQAPAGRESHVVLEARRPVWIRVRTDGTADTGHTLAAGERRNISGSRISIRAGNAGALAVSVNGGPFGLFGREGQPLTRDFGNPTPAAPRRAEDAAPAAATASRPAAAVPATVAPKVGAAAATLTIAPKMPAATPSSPTVTPKVASASPAPTSAPGAVTRPPTSAAAQPSSTAAAQPAPPPPSAAPAAAAAPEVEIVRSAETWLMAFFNRDQPGMTRIGGSATVVDDQRTATDRPPAGIVLRRSLEQVRVQLVNSSALYTARLIETPQDGGTPFVSLISQVWLRSGSTWQMLSVRVMPESKVRATLH